MRKDIPYYDNEEDIWKCEFLDGELTEESGCLEYIVSEFIGDGLLYHFYVDGELDHEHTFDGVLTHVLSDCETFSLDRYEDEYSKQEIRIIERLIQKIKLQRNI